MKYIQKNSLDRATQIMAIETVYSELQRMKTGPFSNKVKQLQVILNPQASMKDSSAKKNKPRPKRAVSRTLTEIEGVETYVFEPRATESEQMPVGIFYHGGGWCLGSVKMHSKFIESFVKHLNCRIYAPEYSKAPEAAFPAGFNDCLDVTRNIMQKYGDKKVNLLGDSSGGNFALGITNQLIKQQDERIPGSVSVVYPFTQCYRQFPSHERYGLAKVLPEALDMCLLNYSGEAYTEENLHRVNQLRCKGEDDGSSLASFVRDVRVSPLLEESAILKGALQRGVKFHFDLAELDPLLDEGMAYYTRMKELESEISADSDLVSMRMSHGCTHAWAQVLAPSAKPHAVGPFKLTPESANEVRNMLSAIKNVLVV